MTATCSLFQEHNWLQLEVDQLCMTCWLQLSEKYEVIDTDQLKIFRFTPKLHQGISSSFPLSPNKSQNKGLHFAGEKGYKLQYIPLICCQVQTAQYQPNFGWFKSRRTSVQEL